MNATITIVKVGSTFPELRAEHGDFEDWITAGLRVASEVVYVLDAGRGDSLELPESTVGVVITGSHAMVTDHEPWSDRVAAWLPGLVTDGMPLLGICYGHQLLAQALGGEVDFHPDGAEMGTVTVYLESAALEDPLFCLLPTTFPAHVAHRQSVLRLPGDAVLLASNDFEKHHAFRIGACAWGVQFHPEFNAAVTKVYLEKDASRQSQDGGSHPAMDNRVLETIEAGSLLQRFARFAISHSRSGPCETSAT